jgi:hypothetical protein
MSSKKPQPLKPVKVKNDKELTTEFATFAPILENTSIFIYNVKKYYFFNIHNYKTANDWN